MTKRSLRFVSLGCALLVLTGLGFEKPANAQSPSNVDELLANCPSPQDIASINSDFALSFESDPTAGTFVCTAANGSQDLTLLQKNAYQILRVARQVSVDAPFPWTTKTLYDWLKGAIIGIRFRGDITGSFCCDPDHVINVEIAANSTIINTERWVDPQISGGLLDSLVLVVHEARHSDGFPHTCGPYDQTMSELGAWGVQYYLQEWLSFHSETFFTATDPAIVGGGTDVNGNPLSPDYYRLVAWIHAQFVRDGPDFCTHPLFLNAPTSLDFGNQEVSTTSVARTVALTAGTPASVGVSNIGLTGDNAGDFILNVVSCPSLTVPPSCVLTIAFVPRTGGAKTAEVTITDTAEDSPHTVPLSGNGALPCAPPALTLSTSKIVVVIPTASATGATVDLSGIASATSACDPNPTITNNAPAQFPIGVTSVTFTATDHNGNSSQKQLTVQVVYNFTGFFSPIPNASLSAGMTVPVKFLLTAADGSVVSNATGTLQAFMVGPGGALQPVPVNASGASNTGDLFRFDPTGLQYIYNLSTKGNPPGTYLLRTVLNDATRHDVNILLK